MIERIKKLIAESVKLNSLEKDSIKMDGFKIIENKITASELFFVKKGLDMYRAKDVHNFNITIYKNFTEEDVMYTGSSSAIIHPTMNDEEILQVIEEVSFAASFIKNKYYPLVEPSNNVQQEITSNFSEKPLNEWLPILTAAIYNSDTCDKGGINSSEIFLNKVYTRIVSSTGIDVSFTTYKGEVEFITNWKEDTEEIELYKHLDFSEMDYDLIDGKVKEMLIISKEKAIASPTPALGNYNILLNGTPVIELLNYYVSQSSAKTLYNEMSTAKLGENIQGDDVQGDLITLTLDPFMKNSTKSSPYDSNGFPVNSVKIFNSGVLNRYHGDLRHCHYLNIEPTGNISNFIIESGKHSIADLKVDPYLEIIAFSDFQMDTLTGDFAGEIRLGWFSDGTNTIPVTGGSVSGNIKKLQKQMYLSKEMQKDNNFIGPKIVKLLNVSVAGIE
ncbi:metallopeptidase TldD-related protein [Clostridium tagluense]|uniref:metallopeptidase TldD-related protein n=1 Tax=Clostridium tagluense TaxID=360422 RepID=UPI001C6EF529|nr:metallopeptidase TldD-related protein [Clostridium tagluense]MBW9159038.1 TldD/PmbA family protein [Clostridium tagluense]WLC63617.1 TldD/PmbA family protein [Clostridium tagluense]